MKDIETKRAENFIPSMYQLYWDNFNWDLYVKIIQQYTK